MSLSRLAVVELQLVMQCCDKLSLLSLARCSRSTLRAARSDFAWRTLSPVQLPSAAQALSPLFSQSLLRHCDVGVNWCRLTRFPPSAVAESFAGELRALGSVPRLRSLRTGESGLPADVSLEQVLDALSRNSTQQQQQQQQLHTFGVRKLVTTIEEMQLLALRQPALRALSLTPPVAVLGHPFLLFEPTLLHLFPALMTVELVLSGVRPAAMWPLLLGVPLANAMQCESMRMAMPQVLVLHRHAATQNEEHASGRAATQALFQIETLELTSVDEVNMHCGSREEQVELWRLAFDSLPALRELLVLRTNAMEQVLMGLLLSKSALSSVRKVCLLPVLLRSDARYIRAFGGPSVASTALLEQFLLASRRPAAMALASVELCLLEQQTFAKRFPVFAAEWTRVRAEWDALQYRFPERVRVSVYA